MFATPQLAPTRARGEPAHEPVWEAASGDRAARAQHFRDAALPYLDDVYTKTALAASKGEKVPAHIDTGVSVITKANMKSTRLQELLNPKIK